MSDLHRLNRIEVIRQSLPKIMNMLAGKHITLRQRGSKAYVEYDRNLVPRSVVIPMIPDDATDLFLDAIQGFLDHEVAHLLFTDAATIKEAEIHKLAPMHNLIEDIYIEKEMQKAFKGSTGNLAKMRSIFLERYIDGAVKKLVDEGASSEKMWAQLCACACRAWAGQPEFVKYMEDKWHHVADAQAKLGDLTDDLKYVSSSWECLHLAGKMAERLYGKKDPYSEDPSSKKSGDPKGRKKAPDEDSDEDPEESLSPEMGSESEDDSSAKKENPEAENDGEGSDADSEDDGETSDPESAESDSEEGEPQESDSEEGEPQESDAGDEEEGESDEDGDYEDGESDEDDESDGDGESDEGSGFEEEGEWEDDSEPSGEPGVGDEEFEASIPLFNESEIENLEDLEDGLEKTINSIAESENTRDKYIPYTTEFDIVEQVDPDALRINERHQEALERGMSELVRPLTRSLERIFVAKNKSRWEYGKRSGKLNSFGLSRLLADDDRIFKNLQIQKTKDVAVQLVLDCSGSMHGDKIELASQTCLAFTEVLTKLKINHEIVGFSTTDRMPNELLEAIHRDGGHYKFSRVMPIHMPIFKSFGEVLSVEIRRRLAAAYIGKVGMHENVDGESVKMAALRLLRQPEPSKAMIVLSDGLPSCSGCDRTELNNNLKETVKAVEKAGIDVIAFGVMTDVPKNFYSKTVIIHKLEELPTKAIEQLRHIVTAV